MCLSSLLCPQRVFSFSWGSEHSDNESISHMHKQRQTTPLLDFWSWPILCPVAWLWQLFILLWSIPNLAKVLQACKIKCMFSLRVTLHWLNSRGNRCWFRMCLLFWLLFWRKHHALPVPTSQLFKWRQCGQVLWFSLGFLCPCTSQLLQWYHRMWRPLEACGFPPQLYSDLAVCAAQRTSQCGFKLFHLTCYCSADKERCRCPAGEVSLSDTYQHVCPYSYFYYI